MYIKFKRLFITLVVILLSTICVGCSKETTLTTNDLETESKEVGICYMDVIDSFSSILYDYEKPNYSYSSVNLFSNTIYILDGEETYNLISAFNNILLYVVDSKIENTINSNISDALYIEVSFRYVVRDNPSNDGIGHFYVLKNGMLVFDDNHNSIRFYSHTYELNFEEIKSKIVKGDIMVR